MRSKHDRRKRELQHTAVRPAALVEVTADRRSFQGYAIHRLRDVTFPLILEKEPIILDFGDHYTGYLHLSLDCGSADHIPDSPTNFSFSFAEMPIELMESIEDQPNCLSATWAQLDFKTVPFVPYTGSLERRYSFRYLKLERPGTFRFPVALTDLYVDSVSAVRLEDADPYTAPDEQLQRIDTMCVKTLKECEQDVFEDGPKRDRRLWIGDLRLQALVDSVTFHNTALIRRCLHLFADHRNKSGLIAPCVFPDTSPYVDQWIYLDYSLCMVPCLYDYVQYSGDLTLANELYDVALHQIRYADTVFDRKTQQLRAPLFIDHGNYDRAVAGLGYLAYILRQMIELAKCLRRTYNCLTSLLAEVEQALLHYYDAETGLFMTAQGEVSWQSQIWAALSGALSPEEGQKLLERTEAADPSIRCSSPFMMHYYLEALYTCGLSEKALQCIRTYWGAIADAGFDCCPECFDPRNERLSPYGQPALNSACHAWSCTPSYWLRKYHNKAE